MEELKNNSAIYIRRFKKERRCRRRLQEELEIEKKRRMQVEEALRMTSAETLKRITESLTRDQRVLSTETGSDLPGADPPTGNEKNSQLSPSNGTKDRRESGDDPRGASPASNTSNVAMAAAAAAAAAAAQFNATVSTSEASSDRGTPPRGNYWNYFCFTISEYFRV